MRSAIFSTMHDGQAMNFNEYAKSKYWNNSELDTIYSTGIDYSPADIYN